MEELNNKFNNILEIKSKELELLAKSKSKKLTSTKNDVDYTSKTTLNKINVEQDRKFKMSKAYKKQELENNIIEIQKASQSS
jgi:hypothetical protein